MTVAEGGTGETGRPRPQLRRATIKDVAHAAGVSQSTAARALSGEGYVAGAVQERVRAVADDLGYVPHAMASSLRRQSSRSIGVLVSDLRNAFYADLAAGVGRRAREHGYTMVLVDDRGSVDEEHDALAVFVGMRVAGVILTPLSNSAIEYLDRQRTPFVEADRTFSGGASDAVVIDNVGASRRMADHLISLGHRRIALFIDETDWTTGADRFRGYQESLEQSGIEVDQALIIPSGWDAGGSRKATVEALSRRDRPTAVFAANNVIAEGVWRGIKDLGLRVPEDVSLVSFDDAPWMSMVTPGVTAVAQDTVALGASAMDRMLARIHDPEAAPETVILPAEMLPRGSTLAPVFARS
ncbi:LacI family DNA-binding transcriptional regulator [Gryllotalpicola reticulitermitis]|uniref:LacI family DNA-binding transcriptional regulator n=1 Tax=Gryllotalpicola reticulitermitis TaxID=1184153 RepID=A0ABV8Q8J0_9MICO